MFFASPTHHVDSSSIHTDASKRPYKNTVEKKPLVVIAGPTAVGKSKIAIDLALHLQGEVVTADSMQIYRGLNISTDKPSINEMKGIPHHMIDIITPDQPFNVVEYRDRAREVIRDIHARGRLPILSGGTGLYIKGVLDDFAFPENKADPFIRERLEKLAEEEGNERVHRRLFEIDPVTAKRLHPNDLRRVIRAIEVYEMTGKTLSAQLAEVEERQRRSKLYDTAMVALDRPREELYNRIEARVDEQIERGLVDEVRSLLDSYESLPMAGQSIGVKEMIPVVNGTMNLEEAVAILKRNTRRYAKRQLTWFRRDARFTWFNLSSITETPYSSHTETMILEYVKSTLA